VVDGASVFGSITSNQVCAYGDYGSGSQTPSNDGAPRPLLYGDVFSELSPQRDRLCADSPELCSAPRQRGLIAFDYDARGFALLNCNVVDPSRGDEMAAVLFDNIQIVKEWPARQGPVVFDNGDVCTVEVTSMLNTPCYSYVGDNVSLDPWGGAIAIGESVDFGLLDFVMPRSFGHDEGFEIESRCLMLFAQLRRPKAPAPIAPSGRRRRTMHGVWQQIAVLRSATESEPGILILGPR